MDNTIYVLPMALLSCLVLSSAMAEEVNFGKKAPSANEIIQHFKTPDADAGSASESLQDSDDGVVKTRGLKKVISFDKTPQHKPHANPVAGAPAEKAISLQILFDYNSANLSEDAKAQLDPVGRALASGELKDMKFKIEGHTDVVGSDDYNIDLSLRRADAVKQFIIQKYGVDASMIQIEGKGKFGLADTDHPTSEVNRRVRIISMGGS